MLFDLRSKGRRRTVRVIYLGLALLMGGGLVLFGVGAGNGNGGILNAFTNNGSNNQSSNLSAEQTTALKQVKKSPNSSGAWAGLVQAEYSTANEPPDLDTSSGAYSEAGQKALTGTTTAYQKYVTLVKTPDPSISVIAARTYTLLKNWKSAATAWESVADAEGTDPSAFECLAFTGWAGGQTRLASLAAAKFISQVPKAQQFEYKQQLKTAQAQASTYAASECGAG
jgi:hypothetical protein